MVAAFQPIETSQASGRFVLASAPIRQASGWIHTAKTSMSCPAQRKTWYVPLSMASIKAYTPRTTVVGHVHSASRTRCSVKTPAASMPSTQATALSLATTSPWIATGPAISASIPTGWRTSASKTTPSIPKRPIRVRPMALRLSTRKGATTFTITISTACAAATWL